MRTLSDLDAAILEFEAVAPRSVGAREVAIRQRFDMSPVRYHQRLNQIVDLPEALAFDPVLVKRLRRVRDSRAAARRSPGE